MLLSLIKNSLEKAYSSKKIDEVKVLNQDILKKEDENIAQQNVLNLSM